MSRPLSPPAMPRRLPHQVHGYTARDLESGRGATHAPAITACTTFCQFVSLFSVQLTTQQRVLPAPPCQFSRPSATTRDQHANQKSARSGAGGEGARGAGLHGRARHADCGAGRVAQLRAPPAPPARCPGLSSLAVGKFFFSWRAAFGELNRARHGSLPRASRGSARTCVRDQLP